MQVHLIAPEHREVIMYLPPVCIVLTDCRFVICANERSTILPTYTSSLRERDGARNELLIADKSDQLVVVLR